MKAGWRVWAFAAVVAGVAAIMWYCRPSPEKDFQPQPRLMTTVVQHMSIDTNGTMRVEKFGVGAERSIRNNQ